MGNRSKQGAKELIEEYFKKIAEIRDEYLEEGKKWRLRQ